MDLMEIITAAKECALDDMPVNTKNPYDNGRKEEAYWTALDCRKMVKIATTEEQMNLAKKIYDRIKYLLK